MSERALVPADPSPEQVIAIIERARLDLQLIEEPREAARFVAQAQAIQYLAQKAKLGRETQNQAAELTIRAVRREGEVLAAMPKNKGSTLVGGDSSGGNSVLPPDDTPTLKDLGVSKSESARAQAVASVPDDEFEQHLAEEQARGKEVTMAGVVAIAKRHTARKARRSELDAREIEPAEDYAEGPGWRLFGGEFQQRLAELPDGCIDAIVTDPPYPRESLPLWSDLAKHAARLLKPQGLLIALTGQIMLPEVIERLGEHLAYGWTYCQPMPGQNSNVMGRHVLQTWKPWLVYSNGTWPSGSIDWHEDTTDPSKMTKSYRWQQGADPAEYLIDHLTHEGDVILDPFTGVGTYGAAALVMGREFIGCEADKDRFVEADAALRKADG